MITSRNADTSVCSDQSVLDNASGSDIGADSQPASPLAAVRSDEDAASLKKRINRRVMPLAEYVAELRSNMKLTSEEATEKSTSKRPPVPVALFIGETEEEYEQAFFAQLKEQLRVEYDHSPLRDSRFAYAKWRVNWYGKEEDREHVVVHVDDLEESGMEALPRAALCELKFVKAPMYWAQIRKGFFAGLKTQTPREIYKQYGSAVPPIYMPLLKYETHTQCEHRFAVWLKETKDMTLTQLANDTSAMEERRLRIEFAASVVKPAPKNDPISPDSVSSSSINPTWRRRVLPLSEFAAEFKAGVKRSQDKLLRKYGVRFEPIPVPLLPGETEEEYDQAFFATLGLDRQRKFEEEKHMRRIRSHRVFFARERARWWGQNDDQDVIAMSAADLANCCVDTLSRFVLYSVKYLPKASYQLQVCSGFFRRLKTMCRNDIYSVFGTVLAPVYMPQEEGESVEQCEERFIKWLPESVHVEHVSPLEERAWRVRFAAEFGSVELLKRPRNGQTKKRKNEQLTPQSANVGGSKTSKKAKTKASGVAASGVSGCHHENADCASCSCRPQDVSRVHGTYDHGPSVDNKQIHPHHDALIPATTASATQSGEPSSDYLEATLASEYEPINEQVVMNEKVLYDSAAELLAATYETEAQVTSCLFEENEGFRSLLEPEIDKRNAALALLIVFMWRNDVNELKAIVEDPTATDVLHIRRASHRKCAELSAEMAKKQTEVDQLTARLASVTEAHTNDELHLGLTSASRELQQLHDQRQREFVRLIRFDECVRLLVQDLLSRL